MSTGFKKMCEFENKLQELFCSSCEKSEQSDWDNYIRRLGVIISSQFKYLPYGKKFIVRHPRRGSHKLVIMEELALKLLSLGGLP